MTKNFTGKFRGLQALKFTTSSQKTKININQKGIKQWQPQALHKLLLICKVGKTSIAQSNSVNTFNIMTSLLLITSLLLVTILHLLKVTVQSNSKVCITLFYTNIHSCQILISHTSIVFLVLNNAEYQ